MRTRGARRAAVSFKPKRTSEIPEIPNPARRNSIGNKEWSAANFSKNPTPRKSTTMPLRTSQLPEAKKRSSKVGCCSSRSDAARSAASSSTAAFKRSLSWALTDVAAASRNGLPSAGTAVGVSAPPTARRPSSRRCCSYCSWGALRGLHRYRLPKRGRVLPLGRLATVQFAAQLEPQLVLQCGDAFAQVDVHRD
jgi:hypothetical protein